MPPTDTHPGTSRQIKLYFGMLMLALGLADPLGMVSLPVQFLLKDSFGLRPPAVAAFEAIILLPVYFGVFFGFLRDRWQPLGLGDRGYLLLAAPIATAGYLWLASSPVSYASLLITMLLIMVCFQFMDTAAQALLTVVARQNRMTTGLSALAEVLEVAPRILALVVGGWLAGQASPRATFLGVAAFTFALALFALWRPRAVFAPVVTVERKEDGPTALRRLIKDRAMWPTAAILLMWNFAPGWGTPFLYYLSDEIGVSSQIFGICKAVNLGAIALTALVYGRFSRNRTLRQMIYWGIGINIFPGALFLVINGPTAAIVVSAIVGLACGLGNIAVFDLLLRSCPRDLEGSAMMLGFSALTASEALGDLLGAFLYEEGGFIACLVIDAIATLCILPLLRWLPHGLIDEREGRADPTKTGNPTITVS